MTGSCEFGSRPGASLIEFADDVDLVVVKVGLKLATNGSPKIIADWICDHGIELYTRLRRLC